ncbi:hypothetical protein ACJX0J_005718, partial [Zea mays]
SHFILIWHKYMLVNYFLVGFNDRIEENRNIESDQMAYFNKYTKLIIAIWLPKMEVTSVLGSLQRFLQMKKYDKIFYYIKTLVFIVQWDLSFLRSSLYQNIKLERLLMISDLTIYFIGITMDNIITGMGNKGTILLTSTGADIVKITILLNSIVAQTTLLLDYERVRFLKTGIYNQNI